METTISSNYQIYIPRALRERLHLQPQQKLTILEKDSILIPHQVKLESLRGIAQD